MGVIHFVVLLCSFSASLGVFVPAVPQPVQPPIAVIPPQAAVLQPQTIATQPQVVPFDSRVAAVQSAVAPAQQAVVAVQPAVAAFPQPALVAFPRPAVAAVQPAVAAFPQPVVSDQVSFVVNSSDPLGNVPVVNYVAPFQPAGVVSSFRPVAPLPVGSVPASVPNPVAVGSRQKTDAENPDNPEALDPKDRRRNRRKYYKPESRRGQRPYRT